MRRILLFLALILGSLLIAGCGGSDKSSSKSPSGIVGADLAPANATAFLSVGTGESSEQWTKAKELLNLPAVSKALDQLLKSSGITLAEVEQALGEHTVVVGLEPAADQDAVMLTDASDPAKLNSVLASSKSMKKAVAREIGDWVAVSDSEATLDRYESATAEGDKLADSAGFKAAVAELPEDALATMYFPGEAINTTVESTGSKLGSGSSILSGATGANKVDWMGMSMSATADGVLIEGLAKGPQSLTSTKAALLDELPSGTSFAVDLNGKAFGLDKLVADLRNNDQYRSQISQFEALLGLKLEDLSTLVGSEMAVYGTTSGFGVLIKATNAEKVKGALDKVIAMMGSQAGITLRDVTIAGVQGKELTIGTFKISYGVAGGNLFIVSDAGALPGAGQLSSDPGFSAAAEAVELPAETAAVFYVDFPQFATLVQSLGSQLGSIGGVNVSGMEDLRSSIEGFESVLGYVGGEGDEFKFKLLVGIEE